MLPYRHYSLICSTLLLAGLSDAPGAEDAELLVDSGPGRAGVVTWESAELRYRPGDEGRSGWRADLAGVRLRSGDAPVDALSRLTIECPSASGEIGAAGPAKVSLLRCPRGTVTWMTPAGLEGRAGLSFMLEEDDLRFEFSADAVQAAGRWSRQASALERVELSLESLDLSLLRPLVPDRAELDVLYGQLSAQLTWEDDALAGQWRLEGAGFDGRAGQIAGDGLDLDGSVSGQLGEPGLALALTLVQRQGELLLGPLYLPTPERPIQIDLALERSEPERVEIKRLRYDHPDVVHFEGSGELRRGDEGWRAVAFDLASLTADLDRAWPRWVEGLAASAGFAGLEAAGQLSASTRGRGDEFDALDLVVRGLELSDPKGRFDLAPTNVEVTRADAGIRVAMDLSGLEVYGLPFGASRLRLDEIDGDWVLRQPLRLPLLEGAVVVDRLMIDPAQDDRAFNLDARIEPLSLEQLTRTLGWPQFGGQLSGDFPGIAFRDDRLDVTGGIDVNAFSGQIRLSELVIERPLGSLPALAAQVEIDRLDLLELTGAFNFGRMEGQLSGWMRDLRLLNWRPVAMDTRLFTHDDARRRRISQRAVDNLSNLGGGFGGALIGNTALSVFEDFPYRRAGLACRLSNNICYIDGVAEHESGGFYIVEGRGLPRLDIIGHRRLVDWPQLLGQLDAATR
jgi:hypothetical protein